MISVDGCRSKLAEGTTTTAQVVHGGGAARGMIVGKLYYDGCVCKFLSRQTVCEWPVRYMLSCFHIFLDCLPSQIRVIDVSCIVRINPQSVNLYSSMRLCHIRCGKKHCF